MSFRTAGHKFYIGTSCSVCLCVSFSEFFFKACPNIKKHRKEPYTYTLTYICPSLLNFLFWNFEDDLHIQPLDP